MITGIRRIVVALLALGCAWSVSLRAADFDVEALLQEFRQVKSVKAKFVERKHSALLTAPLESSGTLEYEAPGRLTKNVVLPRPEKMVLDGDRLVIERRSGGKLERRILPVRDSPALWALVESIRGTLAGDLAALQRFYRVGFEGSPGKWRMLLTPSDPAVQKYLSEVRMTGSRAWIEGVEILDASGDRSSMVITRDAP
jgi:hypothetical protein